MEPINWSSTERREFRGKPEAMCKTFNLTSKAADEEDQLSAVNAFQ